MKKWTVLRIKRCQSSRSQPRHEVSERVGFGVCCVEQYKLPGELLLVLRDLPSARLMLRGSRIWGCHIFIYHWKFKGTETTRMGDDHCNLITFLPVSQVSQICGASLQVRTKHSSTTTLVNHLCLLGNSRILSASPVILAITCSLMWWAQESAGVRLWENAFFPIDPKRQTPPIARKCVRKNCQELNLQRASFHVSLSMCWSLGLIASACAWAATIPRYCHHTIDILRT